MQPGYVPGCGGRPCSTLLKNAKGRYLLSLHTAHFTLQTRNCTPDTPHFTMHTSHSPLHTPLHFTLHTAHFTHHTSHPPLHTCHRNALSHVTTHHLFLTFPIDSAMTPLESLEHRNTDAPRPPSPPRKKTSTLRYAFRKNWRILASLRKSRCFGHLFLSSTSELHHKCDKNHPPYPQPIPQQGTSA